MEISQLEWEECACDSCNSTETQLIFEGPDLGHQLPGIFRMVKCTTCGLIRQNPRLVWESLKTYYPEDYLSYAPLAREEKHWWQRLERRYGQWKRLRSIERFQKQGRLLEIGCGTGMFLEEVLRSDRWEAIGIEPSEKAAEYVRRMLEIPVYQTTFAEVELEPHSFDVIVLWNVLEHFYSPVKELARVSQLLKPNGLLVFSIPNLNSLNAKLFGYHWSGWDLPRHLYVFPHPQLDEILRKIGFTILDKRCIVGGHGGLRMSLEYWSRSWEKNHPTLKRNIFKLYNSWLTRIVLTVPFYIQDRLKASTQIIYIAQKNQN
jgi:SAM-dependent methyltransferase